MERYVEKSLYFFDKFLTFPASGVVARARETISTLLKKKRSRKIMKNYFLSLSVSNWEAKRTFTGQLLFDIFPDYIKGGLTRKKGNRFRGRAHWARAPGPQSARRA